MASLWPQIPMDLLFRIFSNLFLSDIIRSSAVCTSWLAAVDEFRNHRCNLHYRQSPWLLFSGGNGDDTCFYSVLEEKVYTFRHDFDPPIRNVRAFISSSHGWIFTCDHRSEIQMFNPITGIRIDLPSINIYYKKAILSSDPSKGDYMVVLFHHPCTMFSNVNTMFSIFKAGEKKWTTSRTSVAYKDLIFHKSQLYMTTMDSQVEVWDVSQPRPVLTKQIVSSPPWFLNRYDYSSYLVETPRGDLLHVQRGRKFDNNDLYCLKTCSINVLKVDIEAGRQIQMQNFEEYVMFLGSNLAFCLPSDEYFPQRESKSMIYFTDECHCCERKEKEIGVYNYDSRSFSYLFPYTDAYMYPIRSIWINW